MASENPPEIPARTAQTILLREGNSPCAPNAMANISTNAHTCEKAVSTNAFARRDAYPPEKSDAPQRNTAATLYAAGANWFTGNTPEERTTPSSFVSCRVAYATYVGTAALGCP